MGHLTAMVVRHYHPATVATMATGEEELMGSFRPATGVVKFNIALLFGALAFGVFIQASCEDPRDFLPHSTGSPE